MILAHLPYQLTSNTCSPAKAARPSVLAGQETVRGGATPLMARLLLAQGPGHFVFRAVSAGRKPPPCVKCGQDLTARAGVAK